MNRDVEFTGAPGTRDVPLDPTADYAHGCALLIEKGLDRASAGAICAADIRAYFDSVELLLVLQWLEAYSLLS